MIVKKHMRRIYSKEELNLRNQSKQNRVCGGNLKMIQLQSKGKVAGKIQNEMQTKFSKFETNHRDIFHTNYIKIKTFVKQQHQRYNYI